MRITCIDFNQAQPDGCANGCDDESPEVLFPSDIPWNYINKECHNLLKIYVVTNYC